jgi:hypothetical protein
LSAESAFFFVAVAAAAKQMRGRVRTPETTENPLLEATIEPAEGEGEEEGRKERNAGKQKWALRKC